MISDGRPPGWTEEQVARASRAQIAVGRLPLQAQWRIAAQQRAAAQGSATFTSALSVDEFTALRSVGFEPVGQVMGSAVFRVSRPRVRSCGFTRELPQRWYILNAWERAAERMRQECAGLGGVGVVGVRLVRRPFLGRQQEFTAMGTAVRVRSDAPAPANAVTPFASDLAGQDIARLLNGGWLPVGLVIGYSAMLRHDDWGSLARLRAWRGQEVPGATHLVYAATTAARTNLWRAAAKLPSSTVLARQMVHDVRRLHCHEGGHDLVVDALIFGTAIVPHDGEQPAGSAPMPIMRLNGGAE
jgi:uncharacterized protein YbjQ (UPF0145 family)